MRKVTALLLIGCAVLAACSTVDCPLNNTVMATYKLTGSAVPLAATLTVSTARPDGNDSVLLNQAQQPDSFSLPMSYSHPEDVLYFEVQGTTQTLKDTVRIQKTDSPHFESVDCSPAMFHTITGVSSTNHAIESIEINNPNVSYDTSKANFLLVFKSNIN